MRKIYEPAQNILVLIAYGPVINAYADVAGGLNFDLYLHLHPYLMYSDSKGSGESVHVHRLA